MYATRRGRLLKATASPALLAHEALRVVVVYHPTHAVQLNDDSARIHSPNQLKKLQRALKEFGFITPIVVDSQLKVICGNGRLQAARAMGLAEVPTIQIHHLNEAQLKLFAIAENRLCELGEWNWAVLTKQFEEFSLNLDINLELSGFSTGEIDFRVLAAQSKRRIGDDEAVPNTNGPPVSKLGDLWCMGPHRVLCASARDSESYGLLMNAEKAQMVFTDPPYGVRIQGHVSGLGAIQHREFVEGSSKMSSDELVAFLEPAFRNMAQFSEDGSVHFVCIDWRHIDGVLLLGSRVYNSLLNICVYAKHNAGMGSLYRSQTEFVPVFKNGTAPHRNHVELGKNGRHRTNLWRAPGANSFGRGGEEGNLLAMHPTVKPCALVSDAIMDVSDRGGLVLDPFLGAGTTIIASERTGRRCYGLELDPLYVDVIVKRWQNFTRHSATLLASGEPFDDLAARRGGDGDQ